MMMYTRVFTLFSLLLAGSSYAENLPSYDAPSHLLDIPVIKAGRDYVSAQLIEQDNDQFKLKTVRSYAGVIPDSYPRFNPQSGSVIIPRLRALGKLWMVTLQQRHDVFKLSSASEIDTSPKPDPLEAVSPQERFMINPDGTVTDQQTGLQWLRCSFGQTWTGSACSGFPNTIEMEDAAYNAYTLVFAGKDDWRLPSIDELKSLVYCSSGKPRYWNTSGKACSGDFQKPTLYQAAFPFNAGGVYWSNSNLQNDPGQDYNLTVSFNYGHVYYSYFKDAFELARFVRGSASLVAGPEVVGGFKE